MANVVKLSEDELVFITGSVNPSVGINWMLERYQPNLMMVTRGKEGVMVAFSGQVLHFPSRSTLSIDTTGAGAGDAFVAGLLSSLAKYGIPQDIQALERSITLAQTCGALATTAKGAMTGLPHLSDLV